MAKNKANMKKFITGAVTATMVASAIAPVAAAATDSKFTDIGGYNQDTQDKINALVAAGIINGTSDTTFSPAVEIKRGQVVKMLGRYLVESGIAEVPADWNSKQRFSDVPVDFSDADLVKNAAVVFDAKVFEGNNGVLNSSGTISRQNMAVVLDRAAAAITGSSFQELAEGKTNNVADLDKAKKDAQGAIKALNALKISTVENFNPLSNVKRSQFVTFLFNAIEVIKDQTEEVSELKVKSVNAITATTVTVEIDAPTEDLKDQTVVVKDGAGKTYAVQAATIKAGATSATFSFVTPLTVSATSAWTVNGVAYKVAEFAITNVESLNDFNKYLRVEFNSPLKSLDASEVTIRDAKTQELAGIKAVTLATDGYSAQIELLGAEDALALNSNVDYNLSITQSGKVTSKVFYVPAVMKEVLLASTDAANKTVNTLKVVDGLVVDYEELLGNTATTWTNRAGELTKVVVDDNKVITSAGIKIEDGVNGKLVVKNEATGDKYTLAEDNATTPRDEAAKVIVKGANNSEAAPANVTKTTYASAKLVFNSKGEVQTIVAVPSFTSSVLAEKVVDNSVIGYKDELNLKEYTIVKDGKTIKVTDIKADDAVFYNTTLKYAEVFTNAVTKPLEAVYDAQFKFNGKVYDMAGVKTVEDGKVENLTQDLLDALKASGKDVTVSFDQAGNPAYITGTLSEVVTSATPSYITDAPRIYDQQGFDFLGLTSINSKGVKETKEINLNKLTSLTVDGVQIKVGQKFGANEIKSFKDAGSGVLTADLVNSTTGASAGTHSLTFDLSTLAKGDAIKLVKDVDGNVVGLDITTQDFATNDVKLTSKAVALDTNGNQQVTASTPVFVKESDGSITATTFGELDKDITNIKANNGSGTNYIFGYVGYNTVTAAKTGNLDYLVIDSKAIEGALDSTTSEAVVAAVHQDTKGNVAYLKLAINGQIKEYETSVDIPNNFAVGDVVVSEINDKSGKVQGLTTVGTGDARSFVLNTADVKVAAGEFKVGADTYTTSAAVNGVQVYEIVGSGANATIEVRNFADLAGLKANNEVTLSTIAAGSKSVDTIVITKNADGNAPVAPGAPTAVSFTSTLNASNAAAAPLAFTAESGSTVAVTVTDGTTTTPVVTFTGTGSVQNETIDVSSLTDGTITVSVTASTVAGASAATTATAVLDTVATINLTDLTMNTTGFTGAGLEAGSTVNVYADGTTTPVVSTAVVDSSGNVTITGLVTGTDYDVYLVDAAGNTSAKLDITTN